MASPVNASIVEHFETLEDQHIERTKKHPPLDILAIALCTLLSGGVGKSAKIWSSLARASRHGSKPSSPCRMAFPHTIPSCRVFARLNPQRFQECFLSWTRAVAQLTQGALISLDRKTVKASFDRATASSPLYVLSAWYSNQGASSLDKSKPIRNRIKLPQAQPYSNHSPSKGVL